MFLPHILDLGHLHRRIDSELAESVAANKVGESSAINVLHVDVGALEGISICSSSLMSMLEHYWEITICSKSDLSVFLLPFPRVFFPVRTFQEAT